MKIKAAIIILVVAGVIVAANLIIDNRTMSPARLANTTNICMGCHGAVPEYDSLSELHNKKTSFNCSRCHSDISALKTTDKIHTGFKWLGIGTGLIVLTGITTSLVLVSRRNKEN